MSNDLVQTREEAIEEVVLGDSLMALVNFMPSGVSLSFQREAYSFMFDVPKGAALSIDEFVGPYSLKIDFNDCSKHLSLDFESVSDPSNVVSYNVPFEDFLDRIQYDRERLPQRAVDYFSCSQREEKLSLIASLDKKYKLIHSVSADALMDKFDEEGINAVSMDFFEGLYALLRFTVPLGSVSDKKYADYYTSLCQHSFG